jgi:hypothetical protein
VRYAGGNDEVLIDVNLHTACDVLHFTYVRWDNAKESNPQGENFIAWTRKYIDQRIPIIGGFYLQEKNGDRGTRAYTLLDFWCLKYLFHVDYDHIMPITGYSSKGSSVSIISYNDLYGNTSRTLSIPADVKTRKECSQNTPISQPLPIANPTP